LLIAFSLFELYKGYKEEAPDILAIHAEI
jgi:hypothetical protein